MRRRVWTTWRFALTPPGTVQLRTRPLVRSSVRTRRRPDLLPLIASSARCSVQVTRVPVKNVASQSCERVTQRALAVPHDRRIRPPCSVSSARLPTIQGGSQRNPVGSSRVQYELRVRRSGGHLGAHSSGASRLGYFERSPGSSPTTRPVARSIHSG